MYKYWSMTERYGSETRTSREWFVFIVFQTLIYRKFHATTVIFLPRFKSGYPYMGDRWQSPIEFPPQHISFYLWSLGVDGKVHWVQLHLFSG